MDIGNQQRVIIVELDEVATAEPAVAVAAKSEPADLAMAAEWPLPLDLDLEPVS